MKLSELLAEMTVDELERLVRDHGRIDETLSRSQLLGTIESVLRSYRFLHEFLVNRQPPTFAILTLLLEAPTYSLPVADFETCVLAETQRLCDAIDRREILGRDDQLRIYRRVLYQARSSDTVIDASEAAILGTLRQELDIGQADHFLIEHHSDLREFWLESQAFAREFAALRSAGLVHVRGDLVRVPSDLVGATRQVLGVDMPATAARRLYGYLSNQDLYNALSSIGAPTSGSKEERIERLVAHMAQPRVLLRLRSVGMERLRELCRDIGATVSGSKDDLVERIVVHIAAERDLLREPEPPPPVREERRLDEVRFGALFSRLRGHELADMLGQFDLRRWGSKEQQVRTLWEAHRSEATLLSVLLATDLERLLRRLDLRTSGSKTDRIDRLIQHFASRSLEALLAEKASSEAEHPESAAEPETGERTEPVN